MFIYIAIFIATLTISIILIAAALIQIALHKEHKKRLEDGEIE